MRDVGLVGGSQRDAPCAGLQLARKEFWSHGGFAVRRELDSIGGDELLHPIEIVLQPVFIEDGCWQAEVFVEQVPVELGDILGIASRFEKAQALVQ